MLWCQGAQNIGLSNRKLKSALKCTIRPQCMPEPDREMDRQTDEHHGNRTMICSMNASRANNSPSGGLALY